MNKHLVSLGVSAALAAAALFAASANAQSFPRSGPGEVFNNGPNGYRDDRGRGERDDWNRGRDRIDFQRAQESCSHAGIQEAWSRGYYSAQYEGGPRIENSRRGPELRGRMRLHDRKGYSFTETVCELRRGSEAADFDFVR